MSRNQSQVPDLYAISLATDKNTNKKMLYLQVVYLLSAPKKVDLNIEKLQPHKRVTFLKICEYIV